MLHIDKVDNVKCWPDDLAYLNSNIRDEIIIKATVTDMYSISVSIFLTANFTQNTQHHFSNHSEIPLKFPRSSHRLFNLKNTPPNCWKCLWGHYFKSGLEQSTLTFTPHVSTFHGKKAIFM